MKTFVALIAALIITGCGVQPAPERITMTLEYDGMGDAVYIGCMAGLARRDIERGYGWTEYTLQANSSLCEEVRRRFDRGHRVDAIRAEVF